MSFTLFERASVPEVDFSLLFYVFLTLFSYSLLLPCISDFSSSFPSFFPVYSSFDLGAPCYY